MHTFVKNWHTVLLMTESELAGEIQGSYQQTCYFVADRHHAERASVVAVTSKREE